MIATKAFFESKLIVAAIQTRCSAIEERLRCRVG